jgi:hypothetical protein
MPRSSNSTCRIAAPFYLRKLGELKRRNVAIAVAAFLCLLVPTVGSFYPAPPYPVNLFPYIFLAFMLLGGARLYQMHRTAPDALPAIQRGLELALAASAHDIAVSEELHEGFPHRQRITGPATAAPGSTAAPTGVGMVSASTQKE